MKERKKKEETKQKKLTKKEISKLERREIRKQFKEWSILVRKRDGNKCVICGESKIVHAHHLIPREIHDYRFQVDNGISLCPRHHKYATDISAHRNSIAFYLWLQENRPDQFNLTIQNVKEMGKK